MQRNIFLCGFMGSGKTMCGRKIADMLHYTFYDLDHLIEEGEHKSISAIFEENGEAEFRKLEQLYLESQTIKKPFVMSLGGGTVCKKGMPEKIKNKGWLFYLNPSVELLAKRLEGNTGRPLLKNDQNKLLTGRELETHIRSLLSLRRSWYRKAHFTINIEETMTVYDVANLIVTIIKKAGLPV